MKKIKLISILSLGMILLFAACKKEEKKFDTPPLIVIQPITKYIVDDEYQKFTYSQDKLSNIEVGTVGGSAETTVDIKYDGDKLIEMIVVEANDTVGKLSVLSHNSFDLPKQVKVFSKMGTDFVPTSVFKYTYNGNLLIKTELYEIESNQEVLDEKFEYEYYDENVVKKTMFKVENGSETVYRVMKYSYDDKMNPAASLGLIEYNGESFVQYMNVMGLHNYVKLTSEDAAGNVDDIRSHNKAFEYDGSDFPTKCTMTSFDGNEIVTIKYEY